MQLLAYIINIQLPLNFSAGLSSGETAAIVICMLLLCAALLGGGVWFYFFMKKRNFEFNRMWSAHQKRTKLQEPVNNSGFDNRTNLISGGTVVF